VLFVFKTLQFVLIAWSVSKGCNTGFCSTGMWAWNNMVVRIVADALTA
jgi:hypothetical protein